MTLDPETPFVDLLAFVKNFNKYNPKNEQPITDEILSTFNELAGVNLGTAWNDVFFAKWNKYNEEFDKMPDLTKATIKKLSVDFGTSYETFEDELLLDQIKVILSERLKRKYYRTNDKKRSRGQKQSPWLRTCIKAKPIVEKLFSLGVSPDLVAHFFGVDPDTFKRKTRTVFKKVE